MKDITRQSAAALAQLLDQANMKKGQVLVVGCSTSEVRGKRIGSDSTMDVAEAILDGLLPLLEERGIFLAVQCCEHLNRAIVLPESCAEKYFLDEVSVRPVAKAGGPLATAYYERLESPCVVEGVKAHAGIDIGATLIGMNLRPVAVPVRINDPKIGEAQLILARTRPKLIGGTRAQYN
ncbi:MAG: TIGR01440 family protein [Christensenellales bacterium]|jgi:uncharacterized protein (TIGR01440 family)